MFLRPTLLILALAQPALADRSPDEAARIAAATAPPTDFDRPQPFERMSGGIATLPLDDPADRTALTRPSPALPRDSAEGLDFELGAALFAKLWVPAPSSTRASDGLGPLYNARSCLQCHPGNGRGHPPASTGPASTGRDTPGLVLRLSVPATPGATAVRDWLETRPDPHLGRQLQDHALPGMAVEGRIAVTWMESIVTLSGDETVRLRRPDWRIEGAPENPERLVSPRLAQAMVGIGLLEAIPAEEILARADPDDRDGDGISGRANEVVSALTGQPMLGRFGWKATEPSVLEQVASAFSLDLGISSPPFPEGWGDCTPAQTACRSAPDGHDPGLRDGTEIDGAALALTARHVADLAVPGRRGADAPEVLAGKRMFWRAGCADCHVPAHVTARLPDRPGLGFQLIWPHTDLLLHDMGEELADHRPDGLATGREWRTAPLWGIGIAAATLGQSNFLHDGRAGSLLEAILWHGGEARPARDRVVAMPPEDRAALIRYLESL